MIIYVDKITVEEIQEMYMFGIRFEINDGYITKLVHEVEE